jgi:hypothetical protein
MMVCCLFFNFVEKIDFGCCSLAQKMIFVIWYLPCFRESLITCLPSAFLPFLCLFTDSSWRLAPFSSPFFGALSVILPLLLFIVQFWGFFGLGGFSLPRGLCWFILGIAGGFLCDA